MGLVEGSGRSGGNESSPAENRRMGMIAYFEAVRFDLAPTLVGGLAVAASVVGCGAAIRVDADAGDAAVRGDAEAPSSDPPSIVRIDATPPQAACDRCSVNSDCGEYGSGCMANDGGGPGYCAPGCNKDRYCAPDRTCADVSDPSGLTWAACLPIGGCAAAP